MNVDIPEELHEKMLDFGDRINWSNVAAAAFSELIAKNKVLLDLDDLGAATDRLRASKVRHAETASEYWKSLGRRWAKIDAEYVQLMRLCSSYVRDSQLEGWPIFDEHLLTSGQQLCEILDPGGNLHPDEVFGDLWTEIDLNTNAVKEFCGGAAEIFNSLKERI
jgi:hypothetical protein